MSELNFTQKEHLRHLEKLAAHHAHDKPVYAAGIGLYPGTCNELVVMGVLSRTTESRKYLYSFELDAKYYMRELQEGKINDDFVIGTEITTCARSLMSGNDGALYPAFLHLYRSSFTDEDFYSVNESKALERIKAYFDDDIDTDSDTSQSRRSAAHFSILYDLMPMGFDAVSETPPSIAKATLDSKTALKYKGAKMTAFDLDNIKALENHFAKLTGKKPPKAFIYSAALLALTLLLETKGLNDNA